MKKYLIIVRAGDKSLHPQWLDNENRNWDIAVSYYGNNTERYKDLYDFIHLFKGSKWEGISNFISINKELIFKYKYIWIPDDDIFTKCQDINYFFNICEELDATIAQPALTPYSYLGWEITKQDPKSYARMTNFVEIMAPCFKVDNLSLFLDSFSENSSGFGYEWLWNKIAMDNRVRNFYIVDETPVYHTRPVGQAGHGGSTSPPKLEMQSLFVKFNLTYSLPQVIKVIPKH